MLGRDGRSCDRARGARKKCPSLHSCLPADRRWRDPVFGLMSARNLRFLIKNAQSLHRQPLDDIVPELQPLTRHASDDETSDRQCPDRQSAHGQSASSDRGQCNRSTAGAYRRCPPELMLHAGTSPTACASVTDALMRTNTERNKTHRAARSGPMAITARICPGGQPSVSRSPITKGLHTWPRRPHPIAQPTPEERMTVG